MNPGNNGRASLSNALARENKGSAMRLLGGYTLLFALFFAAVFSPFWLYGRTFLMEVDGNAMHFSSLTYFRYWLETILENLSHGKVEIPFWSMWIGFGENTLSNGICFEPLYLLSLLFRPENMESFFVLRLVLRLYCAGLAFLAFGRTRVRAHADLLIGCMIYLFSGFVMYYGPRYSFFVNMMIELPLLLLGVDRIFEKKWSWLFVLIVFVEAVCGFYLLFMITIPAVVYALFHYFELSPEERKRCGGFARILGRHVLQYILGLCLAAAGLLPMFLKFFESSRTGIDSGLSLLHWNTGIYMEYIRGIIDSHEIAYEGYIALPGIALVGTFYLLYKHRKRRRLVWSQIIVYHLVCLIPFLTMLFSAMAGRRMRWSFVLSFWTAVGVACALPGLRKDDGRGFRFCAIAMALYTAIYVFASVWMGEDISLSLILALVGVALFYGVVVMPRERRSRVVESAILIAWLLVELTTKSYEMNSPQYDNTIAEYAEAGKVLEFTKNNAATALEMVSDDDLFRTDVVMETRAIRARQANYGQRNLVNGVSSYYSMLYGTISDYSLELGNAHQSSNHALMDLDQRTALDALAGVKYAAALEDGLKRIPYGYDQVGVRQKVLFDGTKTNEYIYLNRYALPLSYAYDRQISREVYDALPPNRKEQAMLQGALVEKDAGLKEARLAFDDKVLLDSDAIVAALKEAAAKDENLDYTDGILSIEKDNYTIELPMEKTEGEIYLLFSNLVFEPYNFSPEKAEQLAADGASRLKVTAMQRKARQWSPSSSTLITVTTGSLSDQCISLGPDHFGYLGERDMLLNLGYGETGKKLKIKFSSAGKCHFDSIALIQQPMDTYAEKIASLQADQASAIEIDGNRVTVEYDLDHDALACLAIPYSRDWSATVDGQRAELLRVNGMYMGVMLTKGRHTIEFNCTMRGFWPGVFISLAAMLAAVCIAILRRVRRNADGSTNRGFVTTAKSE